MSKPKMIEVRSFGGVVMMTESQKRRCGLVFEAMRNKDALIRDLINLIRQIANELNEAIEEYDWSVSGKTDGKWINKVVADMKKKRRKRED